MADQYSVLGAKPTKSDLEKFFIIIYKLMNKVDTTVS